MSFNLSGETIKKTLILVIVLLFSIPFGYYYGLSYWANGVTGAVVGFVLGAMLAAVGLIAAGKMEKTIFIMLSGKRKANFSLREQLESDLQQIRYYKMRKEYDIALRKVNDVLKLDPDFPEALFLKAQIVWEGFGNSASAISNLEKIRTTVAERQSSIYRWSGTLLEEIKERAEDQ